MPTAFQFAPTPFIHFGLGKIKVLPDLVRSFGAQVLLVTGASSFVGTRHWTVLLERLDAAGVRHDHCVVAGEPSPEVVDQAVRKFRDQPVACVVAIGGGAVLDAGKAIAAMWGKTESVLEYLEGVGGREPDGRTLPMVAVPTTAGTGAEATKNAVLSAVGEDGFKKSLRHDNYVPRYAVVDPELAVTASPEITARCGMDAFTQLLEAFLSTQASALTDAVAMDGLRYIKRSLLRVYREGRDLDARSDMAYAALLSGIALANAGLGTVHGFASSLGGRLAIPHGVICGTLMAGVNRLTLSRLSLEDPAYEKYAWVGALFSGQSGKSREFYARFLIDLIGEWTEVLQIPRLGVYGLRSEDLPDVAESTGNKFNPIPLTVEERLAVLRERL